MIATKLPGCIYRGEVKNEDAEFGCSCEKREQAPATLAICLDCPFRVANHFDAANQMSLDLLAMDATSEKTLFGKTTEVIGGAIGVAKAYFGWDVTPEEERQKRYELCAACSENDCGQCRLCHCAIGAKIRVASQSCPIQKWLAVQKA